MKNLLSTLALGVILTGCATKDETGTYLSPYSSLSYETTNNLARTNLPPIAKYGEKPKLTVRNHPGDPEFTCPDAPKVRATPEIEKKEIIRFVPEEAYLESIGLDDPNAPVPL